MSKPSSRDVTVPEGLREILEGFTIEVIRNQPRDICDFALQYFADLKNKQKKQTVKFNYNAMQVDSEIDEEEYVGNVTCTSKSIGKEIKACHVMILKSDVAANINLISLLAPVINRLARRKSGKVHVKLMLATA